MIVFPQIKIMKETKRGLESENAQEAAIITSGQFKRILKDYCAIEAKVVVEGDKAVFETTNPSELRNACQLVTDISKGRLVDEGDGVVVDFEE